MGVKPESTFISNVHKYLQQQDPRVYFEKMHNPYRGGTPDVWYDSPGADLWAEYKWYPRIPRRIEPTSGLSTLQYKWLDRAARNGRNVAIITGYHYRNKPYGFIFLTNGGAWYRNQLDHDHASGLANQLINLLRYEWAK